MKLCRWLLVATSVPGLVPLSACVSAPVKRDVQTTASVASSYEQTWSSVVDVFAQQNWPVLALDKESGIITTDWADVQDPDKFADCGTRPLPRDDRTVVRFNVRVKPRDGQTEIGVNATFRLRESFDTHEPVPDCVSKGTIERFIHSRVEQRAASAPAAATTTAASARFYCAAATVDPSVSTCARSTAGCARGQSEIVARLGDATECTPAAAASCFQGKLPTGNTVESCHLTPGACDAQRTATASKAEWRDLTACVAQP